MYFLFYFLSAFILYYGGAFAHFAYVLMLIYFAFLYETRFFEFSTVFLILSPDRGFYDYVRGVEPTIVSLYAGETSVYLLLLSCMIIGGFLFYEVIKSKFQLNWFLFILFLLFIFLIPKSTENIIQRSDFKYILFFTLSILYYLYLKNKIFIFDCINLLGAASGMMFLAIFEFARHGFVVPFYTGFTLPICCICLIIFSERNDIERYNILLSLSIVFMMALIWILYPSRGQFIALVALAFLINLKLRYPILGIISFVSLGSYVYTLASDADMNFLIWKLATLNPFDSANSSSNMRLQEILNIYGSLSENAFHLLFGKGLGATYVEAYLPFSGDLSSAFSEDEIRDRVFFGTHGFLLEVFLKTGVLGLASLVLFLWLLTSYSNKNFVIRVVLLIVLTIITNYAVTTRLVFTWMIFLQILHYVWKDNRSISL